MANEHTKGGRGAPEYESRPHHDMISADMVDYTQPRQGEDGKYLSSWRPLFMPNVVSQTISSTMRESSAGWEGKACVSMDALFVPYGGVYVSGITHKHPTKGTGFRLALSTNVNIVDFKRRNLHGYDADTVAWNLPTREYPIGWNPDVGGTEANSATLNPLHRDGNIAIVHRGSGIEHIQDLSPLKTTSEKDRAEDPRSIALRGPVMIAGWGFDTAGFPVPNAFLDADETIPYLDRTATDKADFIDDHIWRMDKWKVGPLDVKWDRNRKVWATGGEGAEIRLLQAANCFNYAGWAAPYNDCIDGNPQCCFTDESGMGVPEPPFYGGLTAEFQTCCPGSSCRGKQCATNYWTCDSCDNISICVTKTSIGQTARLEKDTGTGTRIQVDDVTCLRKAITGLGVCTGAPQYRTRQDCEGATTGTTPPVSAGLTWVPSQGNTLHVMISKDLDEAFAGNPSLKPDFPNLTPAVGAGASAPINFNGVEVIKISDVQFTDPKCVKAKCPGYLEIAPDTGIPAQNRGLSAPSWDGCSQSESNPCMPNGQTCGGSIDEEGMRARGCPSVWEPPFYIIGPGLAFHDAIEIRQPVQPPNGYSTNSPPDWEAGHKETPTETDIQKGVVENVLLHSLKRSQFFYGLKTGRTRKTLVDVRAGSDPEPCGTVTGSCGGSGQGPCCCEVVGNPNHKPAFQAAYGTGCPPVEIFDSFSVYWILQAEFEYKNVATKVTCDPDTFEITVCTRKIPVEGGSSCEYCPGFTTCLSGDETSGVGNLY